MADRYDEHRTIRVFISSTFRDMHAERDYLSRFVFTELRSRCIRRGADFIGLDLRWGVTEEEAEQEGALAICLKEIERCRPFFVCLLGSRFGWVPPPEEIERCFYESVRNLPDAIAYWYRLDTTTEPPVYRLRRDEKMPKESADEIALFWESKGLPLAGESITAREILRAIFEEGYPPARALFYLRRSGIEKAADFPGKLSTVFREKEPSRRKKLAALIRQLRSKRHEVVVRTYKAEYEGLRIDPSLLKDNITQADRAALGDSVIQAEDWAGLSEPLRQAIEQHGTVALSGMEELGQQVLTDLWTLIEKELDRPAIHRDAYEQEKAYHERFIQDRTRIFLGRQEILDRMIEYIRDNADPKPLVVTGKPGGGKSALMAKCAARLREEMPEALVIPHFIGVSPGSTLLPATLRSIAETLRRECNLMEGVPLEKGSPEGRPRELRPMVIPDDPRLLVQRWKEYLAKAGEGRQVILILDAINQLDPAANSHELGWLPLQLPENVKIILSTLEGDCLDLLRHRVPDHIVFVPELNRQDQEILVNRHLMLKRKRLSIDQLANLLDRAKRPDVGLPLYLLVALEELALFGDYEALSQRISNLPPSLPELFEQVLARLEQDHGKSITEAICGWIAVSRSGLLESEVLDLLASELQQPRARWMRFYRGLEAYLRPIAEEGESITGSAYLDFYHDQLRFAAYRRYLGMASREDAPTDRFRKQNRELAGYFKSIALQGPPPRWSTERPRGLSELPYHQTIGEMHEALEDTLCDIKFVEAKCAAKLVPELVADFDRIGAVRAVPGPPILTAWLWEGEYGVACPFCLAWNGVDKNFLGAKIQCPGCGSGLKLNSFPIEAEWHVSPPQKTMISRRIESSLEPSQRLMDYSEFVHAESHVLGRRPALTMQQGANQRRSSVVTKDAVEELSRTGQTWLRWKNLAQRADPALMTLAGHSEKVWACAYSPDGRKIISGSSDRTLKIWDAETGAEIATLQGHSDAVHACAYSPDGGRIVSASADHTLKIWDAETGAEIATLRGHSDAVYACAYSPDGSRIVSGSGNTWIIQEHRKPYGELKIWDAETGAEIATLRGHSDAVHACGYSPDGRRIVSGAGELDKTLKIWDAETGAEIATLWGHSFGVTACAYSPDGRRIVSGAWDLKLKIWDAETGTEMAALRGHSHAVCACAYSPDGRRIVTGQLDTILKIWDVETASEIAGRRGDSELIYSCVYSPDGSRIISGAGEKTLKIWDAETGAEIAALQGHFQTVYSCAYSPDGSRIVSASADHTIKIWEAEKGAEIATLRWHTKPVYALAFSPDGRRIVSGGGNEALGIWDAEKGEQITALRWHFGTVIACAYSPDGRRIISASNAEKTIKFWDADSGAEILTLQGHLGTVCACAYSPNGRRIVSGSDDRTLKIWDAESGLEIYSFDCGAEVNYLAVKGNSLEITAACAGGQLLILEMRPKERSTAIVTAIHIYDFDAHGWQNYPTAKCEWCGKRAVPDRLVLQGIEEIKSATRFYPGKSPCSALPSEAWDDPRLLSKCPHCGNPILFNPFIVDNRKMHLTRPKWKRIFR